MKTHRFTYMDREKMKFILCTKEEFCYLMDFLEESEAFKTAVKQGDKTCYIFGREIKLIKNALKLYRISGNIESLLI